VARESDDDLRKVLVSWLSSEQKARTFMDLAPRWPVVYDILEVECSFKVLSAAMQFTESQMVRDDLARVSNRRAGLISMVTMMLERHVGAVESADNAAIAS